MKLGQSNTLSLEQIQELIGALHQLRDNLTNLSMGLRDLITESPSHQRDESIDIVRQYLSEFNDLTDCQR